MQRESRIAKGGKQPAHTCARLRHQLRSLSAFLPNARIHTVDADVLRLPTRIRIPEYRLMNPSLPPSLLARLGIRNAAERKGTHFSEMISFVLRYARDYLVSVSSPPISEIGGRGRATDAIFSTTKTSAAS